MWNLDLQKLIDQFFYDPKSPLIFSSGFFFFFWWIAYAFYLLVYKDFKTRNLYLTIISFYFYYKSSGFFFLLLVLSVFVDFHLAKWIYESNSQKNKKYLLLISLIANLGLLFYFKYTLFFVSIINDVSGAGITLDKILLPVGISFYTFQTLSYTIDVYKGELKPVESLLDFAFFVSFFPQLVAGPIVRASDFIPQIYKPTILTNEDFGRAIFLIASGLIKKSIISDYIGVNYVERIFENPMLYSGLENLVGVYGYALQIYCDFSGYSDMAIGIALLLGFHFIPNFDTPYQSSSITEFWRRWHISLSSWLKDYVYIPLGGNRHGKGRAYLNQLLTMLIGGFWHGAAWRFILWGALHGVALSLDKLFKSYVKLPNALWVKVLGILFTFHFVCFCWIFFRAESMQIASDVIHQILFAFNLSILPDFIAGYYHVLYMMLVGYFLHFLPLSARTFSQNTVTKLPLFAKFVYVLVIVVIVMQLKSADIQPFIYFDF